MSDRPAGLGMLASLQALTPRDHVIRLRATCLAFLLLTVACASEGERGSIAAWESLHATFSPVTSDVATLTSSSTLGDYIRLGLARNRSLQAAAHRWHAGLERIPQVRSLPDPQLTYGGFVEPIETRVGPQRQKFGITQRVPWPGKLASASDMAFEEAEAQRAKTESVRQWVVYQVTSAYADYYYLARDVEITRNMLALVRHWEAVAQTRFRTGRRSAHKNVIKAQVELGRLEDRLATLEHSRGPKVARLRELLDLPAHADLPWPRPLESRTLAEGDARVRELLERSSPRLAEAQRKVAARERGLDLARQSYLPDFSFGLDYVQVGHARGKNVSGSSDDAIVAKFGLSLPIWFGRYGAAVSEARARLAAARLDRQATAKHLETATARALFSYHDAMRKWQLYRKGLIPKAEESLQTVAAAFEGGDGDFLDVLDAERVLLEFHLARERALVDRETSLAELEMLTGTELSAPRREGSQ